MRHKVCPFTATQYGTRMDCSESKCMLWDEEKQTCLIKTKLLNNCVQRVEVLHDPAWESEH